MGAVSAAVGTTPERTCVGCGRRRGQAELVRLTSDPAGLRVHLKSGEGRGAYLCPDAGCLEQTVKRKTLQRALGAELGPLCVEGLRELIHQAVLGKAQRLLGLARRAGRVVVGSRVVWQALRAGRVRLLLLSRDILLREEKRFRVAAKEWEVPVVTVFSREELGATLGDRPREVVGLMDDGFANGILQAVRYLVTVDDKARRPEKQRGRGGGKRG